MGRRHFSLREACEHFFVSHVLLTKSQEMSDTEDIYERRDEVKRESGTPSRSRSRSQPTEKSRSRSFSRSPTPRSRSMSRSRSPSYHRNTKRYSRSRSRSRSRSHGKYSSSKHRSRRHRHSHSRSPMSNRRRHVGNRDQPPENTCLGVFGLSLYTTERDLRDVFGKYGPLTNISIVYDHQTGRSRGFSFVTFEDPQDAVDAKDRTNGLEIDGRRIRVDFSITKRAHTPTPGIYMGRPTYPKQRSSHHDDYRYGYRDRGGGRGGRSPSPPPRYRRSPSPYYGGGGGGGRRNYRYSRSRSRSYSRSPPPRRY